MKHIKQTLKLIGTEIRLVITKVLDALASPYWSLYNSLLNRDFNRNPEKYSADAAILAGRYDEIDGKAKATLSVINEQVGRYDAI